MGALGGALYLLGFLTFIGAGIWELILIWSPVFHWVSGAVGTIFGILILIIFGAFILAGAPWYFAFVKGWWLPLVVGYGGLVLAVVLYAVGRALGESE